LPTDKFPFLVSNIVWCDHHGTDSTKNKGKKKQLKDPRNIRNIFPSLGDEDPSSGPSSFQMGGGNIGKIGVLSFAAGDGGIGPRSGSLAVRLVRLPLLLLLLPHPGGMIHLLLI
jgi:hypothetical protein